jgi:hypothetical protein
MTADEDAHMQELEELVHRYRSRIVTLALELQLSERRSELLSQLVDQTADDLDAALK